MTTPNTHRIAAAFQAEKDPQQDAVIAWIGALPKDSRGGVKRSVMKYHLTRALLLYMQSGADTSTALHIGGGTSPSAHFPGARPSHAAAPSHAVSPAPVASPSPSPVVSAPSPVAFMSSSEDSGVPVLTDTVKKKPGGGLRGKIAKSMNPAG